MHSHFSSPSWWSKSQDWHYGDFPAGRPDFKMQIWCTNALDASHTTTTSTRAVRKKGKGMQCYAESKSASMHFQMYALHAHCAVSCINICSAALCKTFHKVHWVTLWLIYHQRHPWLMWTPIKVKLWNGAKYLAKRNHSMLRLCTLLVCLFIDSFA